MALRGGLVAGGTSEPWGVALVFWVHCRVEEEVFPRLDALGRTLMTMEGARGKKKSGREVEIRHETAREGVYREVEERTHCSLLYFRWVEMVS